MDNWIQLFAIYDDKRPLSYRSPNRHCMYAMPGNVILFLNLTVQYVLCVLLKYAFLESSRERFSNCQLHSGIYFRMIR